MEPQTVQRIVEDVNAQINKVKEIVHQPVILTSPIVRIYFKRLMDQFLPNLTVLSFNEIDANIQIQAIGLIQGN
jgi:flagellar biosynthesis protein FlhA